MKMGRKHVVPLNGRAIEILQKLNETRISDYLFYRSPREPLSNGAMLALLKRMDRQDVTPHGVARSCFRDWAGDMTTAETETIEFCLSHVSGSQAEQAYRRTTALDKRTTLMSKWSQFLSGSEKAALIEVNFRK